MLKVCLLCWSVMPSDGKGGFDVLKCDAKGVFVLKCVAKLCNQSGSAVTSDAKCVFDVWQCDAKGVLGK